MEYCMLEWEQIARPWQRWGCWVPEFWWDFDQASLVAQRLKDLPPMQETQVRSLGQEDPLEKEMATHSSILAWRIPWTEELGRLQSTGSQRVGHDWSDFTSLLRHLRGLTLHWKLKWPPWSSCFARWCCSSSGPAPTTPFASWSIIRLKQVPAHP